MSFESEEFSSENINDLKYLDDLIHSGIKEIVLDEDIFEDSHEESDNLDDINLDGIKLDVDDLVICGNGHTIDLDEHERAIFYCTGKNITIKNIIISGAVNFYGGAIYNEGELTIMESTLELNTALKKGGAIYNKGKLTIIESTFDENSAYYHDGDLYYGGAIYNEGELTIIESTFNYNHATGDGGAIYNEGELTITESTFNDNRADWHDGAIYNNSAECTISNSTFDGEIIQRRKQFKDGRIVTDEDIGNSSLLENSHDDFDEEYEAIQKEMERLRLNK